MVEKILNQNCSVCKEPHKSCEECGFIMACKCSHPCDTGDDPYIENMEVAPLKETKVGWNFVFSCANHDCQCYKSGLGVAFSTSEVEKAAEHSKNNHSAMFISKEAI